jgi:hypothetical protein
VTSCVTQSSFETLLKAVWLVPELLPVGTALAAFAAALPPQFTALSRRMSPLVMCYCRAFDPGLRRWPFFVVFLRPILFARFFVLAVNHVGLETVGLGLTWPAFQEVFLHIAQGLFLDQIAAWVAAMPMLSSRTHTEVAYIPSTTAPQFDGRNPQHGTRMSDLVWRLVNLDSPRWWFRRLCDACRCHGGEVGSVV